MRRMHLQREFRRKNVLCWLGSLCGLFRIPFDAPVFHKKLNRQFMLGVRNQDLLTDNSVHSVTWTLSLGRVNC